jgi:hypothetical protein
MTEPTIQGTLFATGGSWTGEAGVQVIPADGDVIILNILNTSTDRHVTDVQFTAAEAQRLAQAIINRTRTGLLHRVVL